MAPPRKKRRKQCITVTIEQSDDYEGLIAKRAKSSPPAAVPASTARARGSPAPPEPSSHGADDSAAVLPAAFEEYYKRQGIVPPGEWLQFATALGCELPCSFRVSPGHTAKMRALLLESERRESFETDENPPSVEPVPWLAPGYAYVVRTSTGGGRQGLRRRAPCFHRWLTAEHESGRLTRQELVSMVPPLVLAPQRGECVLDMCASPGSKTAQLLHALVGAAENYNSAAGVVVANDAEAKRCSILTHQLRRYGPAASTALLVTHHDAAHDPPPSPVGGYDKILCDVPCSGDGTMRKNGSIASAWSSMNGLGRHALQLQILRQGLAKLKVGGRLVYSTCSLNPHENEAVVCAALTTAVQHGGGGVVLEDCSAEIPGLKRLPGLETWSVLLPTDPVQSGTAGASKKEDQVQWYKSYADVPPSMASSLSVPPTVFPPDPSIVASLGLQHVWRLLPHHQDTGGFFVCAFRRAAPAPKISGGIPRPIGLPRPSRKQRKKQRRSTTDMRGDTCFGQWSQLRAPELAAVYAAAEFFHLDKFPAKSHARTNCVDSKVESVQSIYSTSTSHHCLLRRGETIHLLTTAAASIAAGTKLNMVSCGTAILERGIGKKKAIEMHSHKVAEPQGVLGPGGGYVIPQAALPLALRWISTTEARTQGQENEKLEQLREGPRPAKGKGGRVLTLDRQTMRALLEAKRCGTHGGKLKCVVRDSEEADYRADHATLDEGMVAHIAGLQPGGCIVVCKEERQICNASSSDFSKQSTELIALSCWKSDPYWLQVSNNDKAALGLVATKLGRVDSAQEPV